jgi:hypothetical protein
VNVVTANQSCPVSPAVPRSVRFDVTARTARPTLQWRRGPGSGDVLDPSTGTIAGNGTTSVVLTDIVLTDHLVIDVVDGGRVVLRFSLRNY